MSGIASLESERFVVDNIDEGYQNGLSIIFNALQQRLQPTCCRLLTRKRVKILILAI